MSPRSSHTHIKAQQDNRTDPILGSRVPAPPKQNF